MYLSIFVNKDEAAIKHPVTIRAKAQAIIVCVGSSIGYRNNVSSIKHVVILETAYRTSLVRLNDPSPKRLVAEISYYFCCGLLAFFWFQRRHWKLFECSDCCSV